MKEKTVRVEEVTKGKYQGLYRLKIKSRYYVTFIIDKKNIDQLFEDLVDIKHEQIKAKRAAKFAAELTFDEVRK